MRNFLVLFCVFFLSMQAFAANNNMKAAPAPSQGKTWSPNDQTTKPMDKDKKTVMPTTNKKMDPSQTQTQKK